MKTSAYVGVYFGARMQLFVITCSAWRHWSYPPNEPMNQWQRCRGNCATALDEIYLRTYPWMAIAFVIIADNHRRQVH